MKPRCSSRPPAAGYALLVVLLFIAVTIIILAGTVNRTHTNSLLNARNVDYQVNLAAAEAATEKVVAHIMDDFRLGSDATVLGNLGNYRALVPLGSEYGFWTNFTFYDVAGGTSQTYVERTQVPTWSALDYQYKGLSGYASIYRVISGVRRVNSRFAMTNYVQQDVQTAGIPLFQFAIFYNSDMEYAGVSTLTVSNGPVHANGDLYLGPTSGNSLTFNDLVGISGQVKLINWAGRTVANMGGSVSYPGGLLTNTTTLALPIGTNNTAAAVREVINIPPSGELTNSALGSERFYNKSQLTIIVSNNTLTAWVKKGLGDSSIVSIPWTNADGSANIKTFLNTNISFTDQREGKTILTSQIDIGKFNTWAQTNAVVQSELGITNGSGKAPNIVYVADYRTTNASLTTGIRLTNAATLATNNNGLTFATPNPLYVLGNFNAPNAANLNTTNTIGTMPASLLSDAITILSSAWDDTASTASYTTRTANSTTINAGIVAGVVYSTGSGWGQYSGGANNLPRMLETWGSSKTLTINGSLINLYNSVRATGIFKDPSDPSGTYYTPPTRRFNFDLNFRDPLKHPPGTPFLRPTIRVGWATPPPGVTNYVGP
ncbi:MAG: hypothetical protein RL380_240 [Verrucomicrobiota bacterium]